MRIPYALQLVFSTGFNFVYRLLPAYLTKFSGSAAEIGLVGAAYSAGKVLRILLAPIIDRFGAERAALASLVLLAPVVVGAAFANSILAFVLAFLGIGVLNGVFYTALTSLVSREARKTEGLFRLEGMYQLGLVAGPLAGGVIAVRWGVPMAFLAWAALCVVSIALGVGLVRTRTEIRAERIGLARWRMLAPALVFGGFLAGMFSFALDLALPIALSRAGLDIGVIGLVIGGAALISAAAMFGLGRRLEGRPHRWLLAVTMAGMGVPMALLAVVANILLIIPLVGIAYVGRITALNSGRAMVAARLPAGSHARGMGVLDTVFSVGQMVGPVAAGLLIDLFGTGTAFVALGGFFVAAGVAALAVHKA